VSSHMVLAICLGTCEFPIQSGSLRDEKMAIRDGNQVEMTFAEYFYPICNGELSA